MSKEVPWQETEKPERRERPPFKILSVPVGKPTWKVSDTVDPLLQYGEMLDPKLACFAEPTGNGEDLCYLGFSGRFFLDSEDHAKRCAEEFVNEYKRACRNAEEDPAQSYVEVFNLNDLYQKFPIVQSQFGDHWGFTNAEGYRQDLGINVTRIEVDELENSYFARFKELGRPVVVIEFADEYSYPTEFYREV